MICSLVCWRLVSISVVCFSQHQKDDSGDPTVSGGDSQQFYCSLCRGFCSITGDVHTNHHATDVITQKQNTNVWKYCINWISTKSTLWEAFIVWAQGQALWCDADVAPALTSCPYDARAKMAQVQHHLQSWAAGSCTVQDVNAAKSPPLLTFLIIKIQTDEV